MPGGDFGRVAASLPRVRLKGSVYDASSARLRIYNPKTLSWPSLAT
jgi:hypothetical protein